MSGSNVRVKTNNVLNIPGTKASLTNSQLLTSTGSSTLDFFLGGGLAIGTICIIEEDRYNSYASLLMKYFLAEGVTRQHSLFLASGEKDPKDFLKELPASKTVEVCSQTKSTFIESDNFKTQAKCTQTQGLGGKSPAAKNVEGSSVPYCQSFKPLIPEILLKAETSGSESPAAKNIDNMQSILMDRLYDPVKITKLLQARACGNMAPSSVHNTECCSNAEPIEDTSTDSALKIAWRYKNMSLEDTIKAESHNMSFDLTKTMLYEEIEKCSATTWNPVDHNCEEQATNFLKMPYYDLFDSIKKEILSQGLKTTSKNVKTILRIGINSIGTPLWKTDNKDMDVVNLLKFLFILKSLLRTSFAVAVITIPSCLFSNRALMTRIRDSCDTVIELESFVGSDKVSNPLFKDYDGLLHIRKLPVLNTFMYPSMTEDLAFKLKKRGLIIERLHLPPELGDSNQQEQFGCSGLGKKLDF